MFSIFHRLTPIFGRGRRAPRSPELQRQNQHQQPESAAALTKDRDESDATDSWLTMSKDDLACVNHKPGNVAKLRNSRSIHLIDKTLRQLRLKDEFLVQEDISNGRERYRIPAFSYKRHDKGPADYHYVTEHIQTYPVPLDVSFSNMTGCECNGDCSDGKCHCASNHTSGRCYNSKGRLSDTYNVEAPEMIYECNARCKCNRSSCQNMVIQGGCRIHLALFRTNSRGWGVRTLENLKRGTFVGVYSGELISAQDSCKRRDDTYLFNLAGSQIVVTQANDETIAVAEQAAEDKRQLEGLGGALEQADDNGYESESQSVQPVAAPDEDQDQNQQQGQEQQQQQQQQDKVVSYVCDAKFYGNFTRFINHSCEPNVIGIRSFTVHHDQRFPYIAFFTNQDVATQSELTLNYGDNYWLVKCKRDGVFCLCKRPKCRFSKSTFSQTLKRHNEQQKR